jgi:tRNA threonylcarbamoyladenosine modification (KEOPS) complex  Pcc1 subunit
MSDRSEWTASITVRRPTREAADRLSRTLLPEAAREVPRARSEIRRPSDRVVAIEIRTRDTGALRAAMNTFLGWTQLALTTEERAEPPQ